MTDGGSVPAASLKTRGLAHGQAHNRGAPESAGFIRIREERYGLRDSVVLVGTRLRYR